MALCSSRLTQLVRFTPMGFLRSTSAITRGSIRTRVFVKWVESSTWWLRCRPSMPILSRVLQRFCAGPHTDLVFYPSAHCYMWRDDWVMHNVSEVVSHDMSPFAKDAMEKHRHGPDGWELRGRCCTVSCRHICAASHPWQKIGGTRGSTVVRRASVSRH